MKTKLYLAALCMAATLAAGCDNSNEPDNQPEKDYTECLEYYEYFDDVVLRNGKKPSELAWLKDFMQEELSRNWYLKWAWQLKCPENDYIATYSMPASTIWNRTFTLDGKEISYDEMCDADREFIMSSEDLFEHTTLIVELPEQSLGDFLDQLMEMSQK